MDKISFLNMGLIDSVLRTIKDIDHNLDKFSSALVDSIEQNIWQKENKSMENQLSFGNFVVACKILSRLFLSKKLSLKKDIQKEKASNLLKVKLTLKKKIQFFYQDCRLIKAVSYLLTKSTEHIYRFMAYEFLFDIEALSREVNESPSFFLNA